MSNYFIGIDLGGTKAKAGLFDSKVKLINFFTFNTAEYFNRKALISAICKSVKDLAIDSGVSFTRVKAMGLGVPGPVNCEKGLIYYFPNIPGWKNTPAKKLFEKKLKIPVFLDNDVNLMALAEFYYGAGKGASNLLCLTLGTGVGGGLILNGEVFRGSNLVAGEVGHMPVVMDGKECGCQARGCLEAYVGNKAILARAKKFFGKNITLELLHKKAKAGNLNAQAIWNEAASYIGFTLTGIVNLLNIERIVIGGGVSKAGKVILDPIRKYIKKNAMEIPKKNLKVVRARLGYNAGLIGAAVFAKQQSGEDVKR